MTCKTLDARASHFVGHFNWNTLNSFTCHGSECLAHAVRFRTPLKHLIAVCPFEVQLGLPFNNVEGACIWQIEHDQHEERNSEHWGRGQTHILSSTWTMDQPVVIVLGCSWFISLALWTNPLNVSSVKLRYSWTLIILVGFWLFPCLNYKLGLWNIYQLDLSAVGLPIARSTQLSWSSSYHPQLPKHSQLLGPWNILFSPAWYLAFLSATYLKLFGDFAKKVAYTCMYHYVPMIDYD